jgi:hypothetical protein
MPKRLVYTRPDGGVSVCAPSLTALRFMTGGGGRWDPPPGKMWYRWDDKSHLIDVPDHLRGQRFIAPTWFLNAQIDAQAKDGAGERAARRFVHAMQFGGCTDPEAYEIIRDRFCAHLGSGFELCDTADIPTDRWFRDAWVRSHNGGPIDVSLPKARIIHFRKVKHAVERENARRLEEMELFDRLIEPNWCAIREAIRRADDVAKLRHVWPHDLAKPFPLAHKGRRVSKLSPASRTSGRTA